MENLLDVSKADLAKEAVAEILNCENVRIEKIISTGQVSSDWYDQVESEWVCVLDGRATLVYEDGSEKRLEKGEHTFIPAHKKHKVGFTSNPCIWLCVFIKND